jgi:hypothetical protein
MITVHRTPTGRWVADWRKGKRYGSVWGDTSDDAVRAAWLVVGGDTPALIHIGGKR